jgi:hypothetical protein
VYPWYDASWKDTYTSEVNEPRTQLWLLIDTRDEGGVKVGEVSMREADDLNKGEASYPSLAIAAAFQLSWLSQLASTPSTLISLAAG